MDKLIFWDFQSDIVSSSSSESIAYYKFNAGTGDILYDHSGNGNHGTINGATWTYEIPLHIGANLISFMSLPDDNSVSNVLSSLDGIAEGIIGEGVAATANPVLGWVGSLTHLSNQSGYWLKVNQDTDFYVTSENISDPDMLFFIKYRC